MIFGSVFRDLLLLNTMMDTTSDLVCLVQQCFESVQLSPFRVGSSEGENTHAKSSGRRRKAHQVAVVVCMHSITPSESSFSCTWRRAAKGLIEPCCDLFALKRCKSSCVNCSEFLDLRSKVQVLLLSFLPWALSPR